MESLGNLARVEGFRENLRWNGKDVTLAETGAVFRALVSDAAIVDPASVLGEDVREKMLISALRSDVPAALLSSRAALSKVTVDGVTLQLTKRVDNPANPFVSFDAVKI